MHRRRALVTGASRGIGRQTAVVLARAGWDVAITGRAAGAGQVPARTDGWVTVEGGLDETARLISEHGGAALPVHLELLDLGSVRAAAARVEREWGGVDLLVNNAIGQFPGGHARILEQDLQVVADTVTANYTHQLALIQQLLPGMLTCGGGTIVNMCSGSATTDPPAPPDEGGWGLAYAASKAAFGRIAGCVNAEYLSHGIRAFNVDPGFVVTEAIRARGGADLIEGRGFEPARADDAGLVIAWLASDPEADRWLGKVIWSPLLAAKLGLRPEQ
jgi:NAD(P)-dependent dehydrogenase (short-subunit alcohol dehydrogenase family)